MKNLISIAVSSCLLGQQVRYDGGHKLNPAVTSKICQVFNCIPVCPEVGIGLGVPRPTMQLVKSAGRRAIRVSNTDNTEIVNALSTYADHIAQAFPSISGYIFKARSPSCGIKSAEIIDKEGNYLGKDSGIFSARWQSVYPGMPIVEEEGLQSDLAVEQFLTRVKAYAERRSIS